MYINFDKACLKILFLFLISENSIASRKWKLAYTMIRNPSVVQFRVRGKARYNEPAVHVEDIYINGLSGMNSINDSLVEDTWGFSFKCFKKLSCSIPPNIVTNIMAGIVIGAVVLLYFGLPLLVSRLKDLLSPHLYGV